MHSLVLASGVAVPVQLANGVVNGCTYGLLALGIVLIYKSNRIFNFAQAELGAFGAFIAVSAAGGYGPFPKMPLVLAIILGLLAGGLMGLVAERLVIRPLFHASRATLLVATAGLALSLALLEAVLVGTDASHIMPPLGGNTTFTLFGSLNSSHSYVFGWTEIARVIALVGVAIAAVVFFRTRYGSAILAVSQDPVAANAVGINTGRISALAWSISGFIGAAAAILYTARGAFIPGKLSGFFTGAAPLVSAFAGAVLGGMTSLPGAFLGGLIIGIVEQLGTNYMPASVPGGSSVVVCALVLIVLLVRPTGLLGKET